MSGQRRIRLFLDSNVLAAGIVSSWGLDKAALSMCAARLTKLILAEVVRDEVEEALLLRAGSLSHSEADKLLENYHRLIELIEPEVIRYPTDALVKANRHLIRHESDVPVLLSAIAAKPDWFLTHNRKHFTQTVAKRTGLRIATPADFFRTLANLIR